MARPDHRSEAGVRVGDRELGDRLEPVRDGADPPERLGAAALQPGGWNA
jgi:hypothetical protein